MMAIPADELFFLLEKTKIGCFMPQISFAGVLAIYAGTNYFGVFHGYLYYELTRYNSAVELTNKIMDDYPQYSYTIISTTEEMYQSIEEARHEEAAGEHDGEAEAEQEAEQHDRPCHKEHRLIAVCHGDGAAYGPAQILAVGERGESGCHYQS